MTEQLIQREIRHFHLACGLGGGAKGFNRGQARVGNMEAVFRCIGGVDVDPAAIRDFERLSGVKGTVLDLFSLEQYLAFHGRTPPDGWREATTADLHRAAGYERPHIIFSSFPCKGFSGLLAEKQSKTDKYQALNGLTLHAMMLVMEAWKDDPVELIIFENVPRISTRGRYLIDQITGLLRGYGYAVAETTHDCGELGGLAQSRQRFLMVARHMEKVPPFLYEPPKRPLRGVGEVLDRMPLPGDIEAAGPMHRVPALQWKTWVRLAFVEAGKDWRSLNDLAVVDGHLRDFAIAPVNTWHNGALGVTDWDDPAGVVTGNGRPASGSFSVADPRTEMWGGGQAGVSRWDEAAPTVTSARSPLQNRGAVADPRVERRNGALGVVAYEDASGTVAGESLPPNGAFSVADPRVDGHDKSVMLGVRRWDRAAGVVTGKMYAGGGPHSVADPRLDGRTPFNNVFRIVPWSSPAPAVTSAHGSMAVVADPRMPEDGYTKTKYQVTPYDAASRTVIGASTTGDGAFALADPRTGYGPNSHRNKLKVVDYEERAPTMTGSDRVGSGALSVADPRPDAFREGRSSYVTQGHYGVLGWEDTTGGVTAYGQADNGRWSVADERVEKILPALGEQLTCVIIARDGTWHRPFTTLELAALQSLYDPEDRFELDGRSDSAWRERIGNAVPSAAAEAIASTMGQTLLLAWAGESFMLSSAPIWVRPLAIALAVDTTGQVPA